MGFRTSETLLPYSSELEIGLELAISFLSGLLRRRGGGGGLPYERGRNARRLA